TTRGWVVGQFASHDVALPVLRQCGRCGQAALPEYRQCHDSSQDYVNSKLTDYPGLGLLARADAAGRGAVKFATPGGASGYFLQRPYTHCVPHRSRQLQQTTICNTMWCQTLQTGFAVVPSKQPKRINYMQQQVG